MTDQQEEPQNHNHEKHQDSSSPFHLWNRFTLFLKRPLLRALVTVTKSSARHPITTIVLALFLSLGLAVIGVVGPNFEIENEGTTLWTPTDCISQLHGEWLSSVDSGFPQPARNFQVIIHADFDNVLTTEGANRVFDVIETVQTTEGYSELCALGRNNEDGECPITSASGFWEGHDRAIFQNQTTTDQEVRQQMSASRFANEEPVDRSLVFGKPTFENDNDADGVLESATAYIITVGLPPEEDEALPYELDVTNRLFDLKGVWEASDSQFTLEVNTYRSFDDELNRGINEDIPLMVAAFLMMGIFCSIVLARRHKVRSQSIVGLGAISTILLSIMTGYGLMFVCGVPFTSLVQIFPYVMVGIGLDDTFIITGAFQRTDPNGDVVERIGAVMEEVGVSVSVSTMTTFVAFMLSGVSSLPGARWFAWYSGPTVAIDFLYQITFFVAILALDDRRQRVNRRDCCPCCKVRSDEEGEEEVGDAADDADADGNINNNSGASFVNRMFEAYSTILLKPAIKVLVLLLFAALLGLGAWSASQQTQEFDFRILTPTDSFVRTFFGALDTYVVDQSNALFITACYFRGLDVSQEANQAAMYTFVENMIDTQYITNQPTNFWLRDFDQFINPGNATEVSTSIQNLDFDEQVDVFLKTEPYSSLYKNDVVRDEDGTITASRVYISFDQVNAYDNELQIDVLQTVQDVARSQGLNQNVDSNDWPVFSFGEIYYAWELYSVLLYELLLTVSLGLVAVFLLAMIFIPHPLGAMIVTPVVAAIYVELLGILYVADIYLNSVSSVGLMMAIGLVVDYNMHVVLTYFEIQNDEDPIFVTREDRVKKVLNTMGKSILLGGFSTFLGVVPLSFSSSEIFRTFFVTFLGIVFLGVGHGLMFTPVVLSLIAPHKSPATTAVETATYAGDVVNDKSAKNIKDAGDFEKLDDETEEAQHARDNEGVVEQ